MLSFALTFAIACFAAAFAMNLIAFARAPSLPDRILAVDTMVVNIIALTVLYGVKTGSSLNFDVALLFALTGFVSTVALCKYLLRGSIIE
ncbi:MAG: K+/H+ antiporter subunit F [Paracoccaceae bacterium]